MKNQLVNRTSFGDVDSNQTYINLQGRAGFRSKDLVDDEDPVYTYFFPLEVSSQMKVIDQSFVGIFDMLSYYGGIIFITTSILAFFTS